MRDRMKHTQRERENHNDKLRKGQGHRLHATALAFFQQPQRFLSQASRTKRRPNQLKFPNNNSNGKSQRNKNRRRFGHLIFV